MQLEKGTEQVTKALKLAKRKMDKCLDNVKEIASRTPGALSVALSDPPTAEMHSGHIASP